ncbi:hypothetical protein GA830_11755 [Mesorhizobium sp. NBSH29]|uniref:hypothetical protein n=1 Tax=Mesorhizobium sp. NBSH29 TaxID=2654249 RepID=UPI0018969E1E|nr:hypothetical protein [Mesorhizobium sp. NBSH29]QPC87340.1 hypothetical protein GA830_11755 [Mesorhizobium sp. NBSH29]
MKIFSVLFVAAIGLTHALSPVATAQAADLAVGTYQEDQGICGEPKVLRLISKRFDYQVRHVPHLPNVGITEFYRIYQHQYLPARDEWPIGRRYCGATVSLSDGQHREIWYLIEEGQGFASIGDNVEFCVSGFDQWLVYNGRCRILR